MVKMDVFESEGRVARFAVSGHAGYAKSGKDIVCAAVSALVLNAINSSEKLLGVELSVNDNGDYLECDIPDVVRNREDLQLLLQSMVFGVEQTAVAYPKYAKLTRHSA